MADLLIKGMDMPTNCFNCSTKINLDERRCNYDGHIFEETLSKITTRRDENCPLVEVPAHGRLIDAGELKELFMETITGIARRTNMKDVFEHMIRASAMVAQMIDDAPTVIEASEDGEQDG